MTVESGFGKVVGRSSAQTKKITKKVRIKFGRELQAKIGEVLLELIDEAFTQ